MTVRLFTLSGCGPNNSFKPPGIEIPNSRRNSPGCDLRSQPGYAVRGETETLSRAQRLRRHTVREIQTPKRCKLANYLTEPDEEPPQAPIAHALSSLAGDKRSSLVQPSVVAKCMPLSHCCPIGSTKAIRSCAEPLDLGIFWVSLIDRNSHRMAMFDLRLT